jgi:proteasome lid subunit RPN8/RPN11
MSDPVTPPPAPRGPGNRPSELQSEHLQRVLPVAQSVLWHPTSPGVVVRRAPSGSYPVFFDQKAVSAIHAHYETAGRQGMMGFLVGDLYECPTSHVRYVVIDSTIRLNQAVYGDKTLVIVSRLWDRIQDELQKTEGHLIGWYHSHPPIAVELAPGDVETHLQYFKRPWHVALVLGTEHEGPVAGLFRPRPGETSASLPFYELIESDEGFAGGKKRSILPWINFLSDDPAVLYADANGAAAAAAPPPSAGPAATLQVVRPGGPRTGPSKAVPAQPSGPMKAVPAQPSGPMRAVPAPPSGSVKAVTPPPQPSQPSGPMKPVATGTVARPGLGDRRPPAAPVPPAPPSPPAPPVPPRPPGSTSPPGPPLRRDTQMKPPPNALSNLPLLSAGGYELGDVDSRDSAPGVMTPRQSTAAPVPSPRRTVTPPPARPPQPPRPFAPALAPRKSDGHPGLVAAVVLLVLGGGGFAGWWYLLRKPAQQEKPPVTSAPVATTSAGTTKTATPDTTPAAPAAAPVDSTRLRFEQISDSVATVVRNYDTRMRAFGASQADCGGLSQTLVAVEDAWTTYNVGKRKVTALDPAQTSRDQSLYAAVDSVERAFDKSGCQRP